MTSFSADKISITTSHFRHCRHTLKDFLTHINLPLSEARKQVAASAGRWVDPPLLIQRLSFLDVSSSEDHPKEKQDGYSKLANTPLTLKILPLCRWLLVRFPPLPRSIPTLCHSSVPPPHGGLRCDGKLKAWQYSYVHVRTTPSHFHLIPHKTSFFFSILYHSHHLPTLSGQIQSNRRKAVQLKKPFTPDDKS